MKYKRGFTLIELILVIALIGTVLSMIFSPIIFSLKNFDSQNKKSNVISDSRSAMDYLTREIRKVDSKTIYIDNGSLNIDEDTDRKGSLQISAKYYELENSILYKREDQNEKKVMQGINDIRIERNIDKIIIEVTIEDYELSSEIYLRKGEED